ncbi:MAG TPA: L,D-transpeptidase [Anaerolineaceae bacterium]|nr:L,D-transpeptidase [Chloroflexota bacterium]HNY84371.1 L,D-transpeptidase [Anaerolineaceae bacterium]
MKIPSQLFNRREFLKLSGMAAGALMLPIDWRSLRQQSAFFPDGALLGRMCDGEVGAFRDVYTEPNINAPTVRRIYRDEVFEFKKEVIATSFDLNNYNQRWVEMPEGYVYSPWVQKVKNKINDPVAALPLDEKSSPGMWVEITVPVAEARPTRLPAGAFWIRDVMERGFTPKVYANAVYWAMDMRMESGRAEYLLTERYGAELDTFWVDAAACRPISPEETSPIHPDVGDKVVKVDLNFQTLSCFEGDREVYFCEVSTGGRSETKGWATPEGTHVIWRKLVSLHMSAGGLVGYDTPGIGYTVLFDANGAAIHSAYWHNHFGTPKSHGCVNCRHEDAKWIWRWTNPSVPYYPGDLTVSGGADSTRVIVYSS